MAAADQGELDDCEILGEEDEINPENSKQQEKKVQQKASESFSVKKLEQPLKPPAIYSNSSDQKLTKPSNLFGASSSSSGGIPEDMLCVMCLDKRKEVMIQSCRHLVFCRACENSYNNRNPSRKECPICRKEYKKTHVILYT